MFSNAVLNYEKQKGGEMKTKFTLFLKRNSLVLSILALLTLIALTANSGTSSNTSSKKDLITASIVPIDLWNFEDGPKKFSFYENDTHWEVTLEDGKITELLKNGETIPAEEIENYEEKVFQKLDELYDEVDGRNSNTRKFKGKFKFDFDGFESFNFDSEKFRDEMEKLSDELEKMKDIKIDINWDDRDFEFEWDSENFKIEMENLKENLRKLDDLDLNIHLEAIPNKIEIELDGLDEAMDELAEELSDLEIDLSDLEVEMEKLTAFIDAVEDELVSDGYLKTAEDEFELKLTTEKMEVNGEKLPDELHTKYLEMYEDHYGKKLDKPFKIQRR